MALALTGCPSPEPEPEPEDPSLLDPPPSGQGVQIETPEIEVGAGEEIQNCYFFKVSDLNKAGGLDETAPLNLNRVQIAQRDGSHHMNVFRVRTIVGLDPTKGTVEGKNGAGECFKSPNWADWPLVANSQQDGQLDWQFPDGVANVIGGDEWLMVQAHYVNATSQKTPDAGKVRINLWNLPADEVKQEMGTIFATKQSIRICQSNPKPEYSGTCQFNSPDPVHIIGANGHFHSRGKQFNMFKWDGVSIDQPPDSDRFYQSTEWDDPPMLISPELDTMVPANGGVFYTCSYQWNTPDPAVGCSGLDEFDKTKYGTTDDNLDCCYTFGPIVEKNEHCNIFVYYYPKVDDVNCF
ncbi:MAG: hypothetical protein IPK82_27640 [Polyangiaceae bacterium]|nr:hypothetical protein [Polyangiaceae bacterium]